MRWRALAFVCLLLGGGCVRASEQRLPLDARRVELGEHYPTGGALGRIRLLGMLELPAVTVGDAPLAELSDLAWDEDEQLLYAISDRGALFWLRPAFFDGLLVDVEVIRVAPLLDPDGKRLQGKHADSEGLDIVRGHNGKRGDTELIISFERFPRIESYRPDGTPLREHPLPPVLADRHAYREENNGLEAVALIPGLGIVTAPEQPLAAEPAILNRIRTTAGRDWGYPIAARTGIVSMKWLDNKRLLVLERAYNLLSGRLMGALRIVDLEKEPARLAPRTVAVFDSHAGMLTDNFEGLSRHYGNRFFLVSDNNGMFFQRTLLLYFELLPER